MSKVNGCIHFTEYSGKQTRHLFEIDDDEPLKIQCIKEIQRLKKQGKYKQKTAISVSVEFRLNKPVKMWRSGY